MIKHSKSCLKSLKYAIFHVSFHQKMSLNKSQPKQSTNCSSKTTSQSTTNSKKKPETDEKVEKENKDIETKIERLTKENLELNKKVKAYRNYKQQYGCIKMELEKFRALALTPGPVVIYSDAVQLAGFYWKLCVERSVDNWLGLYLCIYVPKQCPQVWECRVNFTFCIKHVDDVDSCIHRSNGKPIVFSKALGRCGRTGFADMVGIYHLLDPASGFVDLQDHVKMGVSFSVLYSSQG